MSEKYSWMDRPDVGPEDMPEEEFRKFTHPEPPTTKELTDKLHRLQGQLRGGLSREEFRRKYEGRQQSIRPRVVKTFSTPTASRENVNAGAGREVPREASTSSEYSRRSQSESKRKSVLQKPGKRPVSSSRSASSASSEPMSLRRQKVKKPEIETGRATSGDIQYRVYSNNTIQPWKWSSYARRWMGAGEATPPTKNVYLAKDGQGLIIRGKLVKWDSKEGNSSWSSKRSRRSMRAPKRSRSTRKTSKSKRNTKRSGKKTKRSSQRRR